MRNTLAGVTLMISMVMIPMALMATSVFAAEPAGGGEAEFVDPFAEESQEVEIADPLEPINRGIFWFNDKLYFYLLKPVARAYRIVPKPIRTSVDNFFDNLGTPVRVVNATLQFKWDDAGDQLARFMVNTTYGLGGLFDVARHAEMPEKDEDLGQTLGRYGIGHGFYLMLPFLGPSSLRDGVGTLGDAFIDPITSPYYLKLRYWEVLALETYDRVNYLSLDKDTYESIKKEALDPYLTIRNGYAQRRAGLVEE